MKTGDAVSGLLLMMETGSGSPDEDFLLPSGRKKDQSGAVMAEKPCWGNCFHVGNRNLSRHRSYIQHTDAWSCTCPVTSVMGGLNLEAKINLHSPMRELQG